MVTRADIANRALQRVGARRIVALTDASKNAAEVAACYDILRRAELRRNVWRFAVRRATLRPVFTTTLLLVPPAWSSTAVYPARAIVSFGGFLYESKTFNNTNNTPGLDATFPFWTLYFGPMTVQPYDATAVYYNGELVYTPATTAFKVFRSTVNNNATAPVTAPPAWVATTTYALGDVVSYLGTNYLSQADLNFNNIPNGLVNWSVQVASPPAQAIGTWVELNTATLAQTDISYPSGTGPAEENRTRNIFILPNGYLREAPQDPKAGSRTTLGGPTGLLYDDFTFENNFLISMTGNPLVFRFVADVSDTTLFDSMFVEGLAARIAMEIAEPLTQSAAKLQAIASEYKLFMTEGRIVNGIETGPTEPPEDDYLSVRW